MEPEWGREVDGGMELHAPYNAAFVDALKECVPGCARRWRPAEKAWWIRDDFVDEVDAMLGEFFDGKD